jgi:hypothetical protein
MLLSVLPQQIKQLITSAPYLAGSRDNTSSARNLISAPLQEAIVDLYNLRQTVFSSR